jgi:hypothetical protein
MHLPKWLYELLPYIYLVMSFAGISTSGAVAKICGGLLMLSAIHIIQMRREYRRRKNEI